MKLRLNADAQRALKIGMERRVFVVAEKVGLALCPPYQARVRFVQHENQVAMSQSVTFSTVCTIGKYSHDRDTESTHFLEIYVGHHGATKVDCSHDEAR